MLQTFKDWPNASVAAICAVVLAAAFLFNIAALQSGNRTAQPVGSWQPDEPAYSQMVGSVPQSGLRPGLFIDDAAIFQVN